MNQPASSYAFRSFTSSGKNADTLLVFLHGFSGSPTDFESVPKKFADKGYSVFVPVLKGHCTKISELYDMTFASLCEDVKSQLVIACTKRKFKRTIFIGYSLGSLIALWLKQHFSAQCFLVSTPFKLKRWVHCIGILYPFKTILKLDERLKRSTKRRFFYEDVPLSIIRVSIEGQSVLPKKIADSDYVVLTDDHYIADVRNTSLLSQSSYQFISETSHNLFWHKSSQKLILVSLKEFINS